MMPTFPDNAFDLAIVDPPYYSGPERRHYYGGEFGAKGVRRGYNPTTSPWAPPTKEYFDELFRVSKNQIIWGCNYFDYQFGPGRIVWDKRNDKSSFSDCELAYCSLQDTVRIFRFMWNGMQQGRSMEDGCTMQGNKRLNEKRIHPTQKPVALYEWCLTKYAKKGDTILDTHVGSGSICIACYRLGFDMFGFEISPEYFDGANKRIQEEMAQLRMDIPE